MPLGLGDAFALGQFIARALPVELPASATTERTAEEIATAVMSKSSAGDDLVAAACSGDADGVAKLLDAGAPVGWNDRVSTSPLERVPHLLLDG